ncbi:hypothetical protein BDQ17DRAFT_1435433 [Cyathus striatus]|nr:hypothetical protein BDQ17DRAFT_1435433 [Cyathus striatus]
MVWRVTELLLEGRKGNELVQAVLDLDWMRVRLRRVPWRPSGVLFPGYYGFRGGGIALPSVLFFAAETVPQVPIEPIKLECIQPLHIRIRQTKPLFPIPFTHSFHQGGIPLQTLDSDLFPEVDMSLFDPGF